MKQRRPAKHRAGRTDCRRRRGQRDARRPLLEHTRLEGRAARAHRARHVRAPRSVGRATRDAHAAGSRVLCVCEQPPRWLRCGDHPGPGTADRCGLIRARAQAQGTDGRVRGSKTLGNTPPGSTPSKLPCGSSKSSPRQRREGAGGKHSTGPERRSPSHFRVHSRAHGWVPTTDL